MKLFAATIKYIIIPVSSLVGIIYGFDLYIIQRSSSVVEPVKVQVEAQSSDLKEIKIRTRNIEQILMSHK